MPSVSDAGGELTPEGSGKPSGSCPSSGSEEVASVSAPTTIAALRALLEDRFASSDDDTRALYLRRFDAK